MDSTIVHRSVLRTSVIATMFAACFGVWLGDMNASAGMGVALIFVIIVLMAVMLDSEWLVWLLAGLAVVAVLVAYGYRVTPDQWLEPSVMLFNRLMLVLMVAAAAAVGAVFIRRGKAVRESAAALAAASERLETHTRLLRVAGEISKVGGWSIDVGDAPTIEWSDEAARILGADGETPPTPDEAFGLFDQDDATLLYEAFDACVLEGAAFRIEARVHGSDGTRWVRVLGEPVVDRNGHVVRIQGAIQDISALREAELHSNRFHQLANSLSFIVWTADPDGSITYYNKALEDYTGIPAEEVLGDAWGSVVHPDDLERVAEVWQRSVTTGEPYNIEFRVRSASGQYRWHHLRARPERDSAGRITQWWGNSIDIHEHVVLKAKAQELALDRDDILQSIGDGVISIDREWKFTYVNRQAERVLDRSASDLLGRILWDEYPGLDDIQMGPAYRRAMESRSRQRFTDFYEPLDMWFDITATPSPQGITVFFQDVTERKSMADQLAQAQRLESVGRLTGGIAHDFNNLLTVVLGGVEALADRASSDDTEILDMMSQAAHRGAELTHRLLAFARRQPLAPEPVDVCQLVLDFVPLLTRTLGETVRVETHVMGDLPPAHIDAGQLESALLNLAINGRDAMPKGGLLTLETALATLDQSYTTMHGEVIPGTYVVVSVSDTGEGIEPSLMPRLFDPFFTTKSPGYGTGLGLPMVWGFAKQSGGHVTVYSEVGHGTTFKLYLPLAPADAEARSRDKTPDEPISEGDAHILLVEDDLLVLQFAAHQLRAHGYVVTVAGSGPQALEVLERMDRIDLLFTDVMMPGGMSGRDLAEQVQRLRPEVSVLYTSGYTENVILHSGKLDADVDLVPKPYSSHELLRAVQTAVRDEGNHG